jgi:DNA repair exonuclease SbcCD ATPase subunit
MMINSGSGQLLWGAAILIGVVLLAVLGGSFFLVAQWKTQIQNNLKKTRTKIRALQTSKKQLENLSSQYEVDDPEPIGTHAKALSERFSTLDTRIKNLNQAYVHQQERFRRLSQQTWLRQILSARSWAHLKNSTSRLLEQSSELATPLEEAKTIQQTLDALGWKIALEARSLNLQQTTAEALLHELRGKNLGGDALEEPEKQLVVSRVEMSRIPKYFFEGSQENLLKQATKEEISLVFEIMQENQGAIEEATLKAHQWHTAFDNLADQLAIMDAILQTAETALTNTLPELDTTAIQDTIEKLKLAGAELHNKSTAMDTDELDILLKEVELITNTARDLDSTIRQAGTELEILKALYGSLSEQITSLSTRFARGASRTTFPILWGENLAKLTNTNREIKALNPSLGKLTPEAVSDKLTTAEQIQIELNDLENTYRRVENQLLQLTTLIGSPDYMQMEDWMENIPEQIALLQSYSPENFSRSENVGILSKEFNTLQPIINQNRMKETASPLNESELEEKLNETQETFSQYQIFRNKFDGIWEHFQELLSMEDSTREKLDEIQTNLGQLLLIAQSNPTVESVCGNEMQTYLADAEALSEKLENRQQGSIQKKSAKADALKKSIGTRGKKWTKQLRQIVNDQLHEISTTLNAIHAIAIVSERAIDEGNNLIASKPLKSAVGQADGNTSGIRTIILEIKRLSDLSQRAESILYALDDIKTPVMATHTQALIARQRTSEMLYDLGKSVQKRQDWPPTSVSLNAEKIQFENLENEWKRVSSRQYNAVSLVAKLSAFESRYQKLAERVNKAATQLREEAQQVEEIENQLDELESRWQDQWQVYSSNPFANQEIQDLLEQMFNMRKQIRQEYRRGERDFNSTLYALKGLQQEIKGRKVMISENQLIDIRGRTFPYRR